MAVMMMHVQAGERWCHHTTYLAGEDAHAKCCLGQWQQCDGRLCGVGVEGGVAMLLMMLLSS